MSTYLVAYIVGEYDYIEGKDSDGVVVRVYTPLGKKEQGQFALEVCDQLRMQSLVTFISLVKNKEMYKL